MPGIIQYAQHALGLLPDQDSTWRSITAMVLGDVHGFRGDMAAAYRARLEALRACEAAGDIYFIMMARLKLAITLRSQGRLQQTIEICERQLQIADEFGLSQTRAVGWLLAIWGEALAELNDLDGAIDRVKKGVELTERTGDLAMPSWSYICLLRVLFSRGELSSAEELVHKVVQRAQTSDMPPWITNQMAVWQTRIWLAQDKLETASQWARERGFAMDVGTEPLPEIGYFGLFEYMVLARLLIAQNRWDQATGLLRQLLRPAEAGERTTSVIELLLLRAMAFRARGDTDQATTAPDLTRGLSSASRVDLSDQKHPRSTGRWHLARC